MSVLCNYIIICALVELFMKKGCLWTLSGQNSRSTLWLKSEDCLQRHSFNSPVQPSDRQRQWCHLNLGVRRMRRVKQLSFQPFGKVLETSGCVQSKIEGLCSDRWKYELQQRQFDHIWSGFTGLRTGSFRVPKSGTRPLEQGQDMRCLQTWTSSH